MDKASMDLAWTHALMEDDGDLATMLIAAGSDPAAGICGGASPLERGRQDRSEACLAAMEPGMRAPMTLPGAVFSKPKVELVADSDDPFEAGGEWVDGEDFDFDIGEALALLFGEEEGEGGDAPIELPKRGRRSIQ